MKIIQFLDRLLKLPDQLTRFQNVAGTELENHDYKNARRKYLFVIADSGAGHRTTANAVKAAIEKLEPEASVFLMRAMDILNTPQRLFSVGIEEAYNQAIQAGAYWLEPLLFHSVYMMELPFFLDYIALRNAQIIARFAPEAIVSFVPATQKISYHSLKFLKRETEIPLYTVTTDLVSMRDNWIIPEQAHAFISTQEAYDDFVAQGISPEKMQVTGLPVHPRFDNETLSSEERAEFRTQHGLDPDRFTLMIMMGGNGSQSIYDYAKAIEQSQLPLQIIACCGRNQKLYERLTLLAKISKTPIHVQGFTHEIPYWMRLSDLLLTKPGSVTIAESISQKLPLMIDATRYIMWQEKGNAEYLEKYKIGLSFRSQDELMDKLKGLVLQSERYAELKAQMEKFPRHNAAETIAEYLLR